MIPPRFLHSVFVASVGLLAFAAPALAQPARPNVVFILIDDMGAADLSCYGSPDIKTPNIDRLAKEGVRLTQCYSNGPVCTPTRCALMTGRWQQRAGLEWAIYPGQKEPGLPTAETSLARMIKDAGYATGIFGKWHLGYKPEYGPNAHGFDEFYGLLSGNVDHYSKRENNNELDWYDNLKPLEAAGYSTDLITERATAYINKAAGKPFFCYVPYNSVHWPFQPPDRPDTVRTKATWFVGTRDDYVKMMERIDAGVGKILAALDDKKIAENTLVIFTSDNGGERLSDNRPFFSRKATLWEGGVRVPGLLRWPAGLPAGVVSTQPVITMDFTASILAACGVKPPAGRTLDGWDVLPVLRGKAQPMERTFYWRIDRVDRKQKSVRKGKWKWIRDGVIELLFDLEADPGERNDLHRFHPRITEELRGLMTKWEEELATHKPAHVVK